MAKGKASDVEKSAKFKELAQKRVSRILKGVAGLAKLSATARYRYTPDQVEKMFSAIGDACKVCLASYQAGGQKGGGDGFKF